MDAMRSLGQEGAEAAPDIACTLGDERGAAQEERWRRLGREAGLGRAETADGLEIRFRDEPAAERELRDLVRVESTCCAWARWEIRRVGGELILRVSSSPEGAAALHAMFGGRGKTRLPASAGRVPGPRGFPAGPGDAGAQPSRVIMPGVVQHRRSRSLAYELPPSAGLRATRRSTAVKPPKRLVSPVTGRGTRGPSRDH